MTTLTEANVEQAALDWLADLGWQLPYARTGQWEFPLPRLGLWD